MPHRKLIILLTMTVAGAAPVEAGCGGSTPTSAARAGSTVVGAVPPGCSPRLTASRYPQLAGATIKVAASPHSPPYISTDPANPSHIIGFEADLLV